MQTSQIKRYGGDSTMRLIFSFLLLFLILPLCSQAQNSKNACGVYHKPFDRLTANQPVDLIDQFGNGYSFEELNIRSFQDRYSGNGESRNVSNCTGGEFTLEFFGFTCDEETTICNVFQEISGLIDIGPNGSSPLITVVKEPFQNDDGTNDTERLGVGITYFQPECGIANNLIFDVMYTDIALAAGTASGVLRINDLLPFYNDVQGPVTGHYDLHTVALHEVLHILGYSSLIANGGGPASGYYSRWDTYLYSNNDSENLITPGAAVPGCCDIGEFNPLLDYSQVITANCNMNIFFRDDNDQNIARTYGVDYLANNPGGLLSHLDRCGASGEPYVMKAKLDSEEEKDLTQEEVDILEALGYEMQGQDVACSVIANNDFFFYGDPVPNHNFWINVYDILANDNLPDDFDLATDFTFHGPGSGCGTIDEFANGDGIFYWDAPSPPFSLAFYRIRIPLCQSVDICYTIRGCDGECDEGIVTIQRICDPCYPYLPDCSPVDMCAGDNLFCYGDFQDFSPKWGGTNNYALELELLRCPSLTGTPDIFYNPDNGNRLLGFSAFEAVIIPLSEPIPPGCTINLSYRTVASSDGGIDIFGSSISPCLLDEMAVCPSTTQSDFQCIASFDVLDGIPNGSQYFGPPIPCTNTSPPDIDCTCTPEIATYPTNTNWVTVTSLPFINNTAEPIEFLYITHDAGYVYVDDLVVTADCDNEIELIASSPVDACRGGETEVTVNICISGTNTTPQDVTVIADFPDLLGLQITPGSDFDGGSALIANTIAGPVGMQSCYLRTFSFQVGYNIPVSSQLEVNFEFGTANACLDINSLTTSIINVIDCEIPCILESYPTIVESCGNDGSIDVIVAGGSGSYTYQWGGGLGNGPSVSGLAPGTYEFMATDVTDPNCYVKKEYVVLPDENCGSGCVGEGTIEIAHQVVQIVCLESEEPGFDRYYIDMYIPNWGGTQNVNFELCSEDLFVTTPGVILESNESYLIQEFDALNIFTIIQVPTGTPIDQAICFETPICIGAGQFCGSFCVTDFPICTAAPCELEVVPTVTLSPLDNTTCGNLSGDDLFTGNVSLAIQNANGFNINYVQYIQINGNIDPVFWQENNIPVIGGIANVPDHSFCWKSYDNQYFCFTVRIGYSDGINEFECEVNICLPVSDLSSGMFDDGGGERRQNDLSFHKDKYYNTVFPVFPNPVNQNLNIQNPQETSVTLTLMTLQGKLLDQQVLNGQAQTRMKVDAYAPGIYLLRIRDASSGAILQMEKVIVAH